MQEPEITQEKLKSLIGLEIKSLNETIIFSLIRDKRSLISGKFLNWMAHVDEEGMKETGAILSLIGDNLIKLSEAYKYLKIMK